MVLEVKNYWGKVTSEGDTANSRWQCTDGSRPTVEVKSSWGVNPYHQVREYAMSLMNLVQQRQPQWRLPVYGIVVFPETADLGALDERIGRYYRVTRSDSPGFVSAGTVVLVPNGGDAGTTFSDTLLPGAGSVLYYLVTNKF